MMKRIFTLAVLMLPVFAFSYMSQEQKDIVSSIKNESGANSNKGKNQYSDNFIDENKENVEVEYLNLDENVYLLLENHRKSTDVTNGSFSANVATDGNSGGNDINLVELKKQRLAENLALENKQKLFEAELNKKNGGDKSKAFRAFGYCITKDDIEVETMSAYAFLSCDIDGLKDKIDLAVSIVPDFYSGALIAKPLYFSSNKYKMKYTKGVLLNANRTSLNIASVINKRKVEKILANFSYSAADVITTQAQAYLAADEASKTTQDVIVTPGGVSGSTTTTATNVAKPDSTTYLISTGIQLVSELAKYISAASINDIKYSFRLNRGSMLFVDAVVLDSTNVVDVAIDATSVINKSNNKIGSKESKISVFDEESNAKKIEFTNSNQK